MKDIRAEYVQKTIAQQSNDHLNTTLEKIENVVNGLAKEQGTMQQSLTVLSSRNGSNITFRWVTVDYSTLKLPNNIRRSPSTVKVVNGLIKGVIISKRVVYGFSELGNCRL
jgi:hypothetical protein